MRIAEVAALPSIWGEARRTLARNSGWAFMADGSRLLTTTAAFFILAKLLGLEDFGRLAGTTAFVSIVFPFASFGLGHLLLLDLAAGSRTFDRLWGRSLAGTVFGGIGAVLIVLAARPFVLPSIPWLAIAALAVSELLLASLVEVSVLSCQAKEELKPVWLIRLGMGVGRLVAVAALLVLGLETLTSWSLLYLATSTVGAMGVVVAVSRRYGAPRFEPIAWSDLRRGLPFVFGLASSEVQDDIDKTMLVRFGYDSGAAVYSLGYRAVSMAFLPVRALIQASYALFFRVGADGIDRARRFALRLTLPTVAYGVAVWIIAAESAHLITHLLGPKYREAEDVVRLIGFLPLLRGLQCFAANALVGSGYQRLRAWLLVGTAALTIVLNLMLIPRWSWHGALWATAAAEIALVLALWASLGILELRHVRRSTGVVAGDG